MEIKSELSKWGVMIEITTDTLKYRDEVSVVKDGKFVISDSFMNGLLDTCVKCNKFNRKTDLDFVKKVYDTVLNDKEKKEFINLINKQDE